MWEFLQSTPALLVINLTGLVVLAVFAFYLVQKFRGGIGEDQPNAHQLLSNFRELHHEGDIGEREYRKIKTVLGEKIQDELRDAGDGD